MDRAQAEKIVLSQPYKELINMTDRQLVCVRDLILINGGDRALGIIKGITLMREQDAHTSDPS